MDIVPIFAAAAPPTAMNAVQAGKLDVADQDGGNLVRQDFTCAMARIRMETGADRRS